LIRCVFRHTGSTPPRQAAPTKQARALRSLCCRPCNFAWSDGIPIVLLFLSIENKAASRTARLSVGCRRSHAWPSCLGWRLANCAKRRPLEVIADVAGGHAAQHGFDVVAVPASEQAPS